MTDKCKFCGARFQSGSPCDVCSHRKEAEAEVERLEKLERNYLRIVNELQTENTKLKAGIKS